MSRIQQIMSKAERDGTLRSRPAADRAMGPNDPAPRVVPPQEPPLDAADFEPPLMTARRSVDARLDPLLVAGLAPLSPASERYRSLRTRIAQAESDGPLRAILVTSPADGDGKTVTALNLGLTMAQEFQRRVLVIDANLRRPGIHSLLGLSRGPGLAEVLTGAATIDDALIELSTHHLTVLRAGESNRWPTEMLGSAQMRRLVDGLRSHFDRIIVDTTPAHLADAGVVAPMTDAVVMVVRAGQTPRPAIERALAAVAPARLLGLVLNESGDSTHRRSARVA